MPAGDDFDFGPTEYPELSRYDDTEEQTGILEAPTGARHEPLPPRARGRCRECEAPTLNGADVCYIHEDYPGKGDSVRDALHVALHPHTGEIAKRQARAEAQPSQGKTPEPAYEPRRLADSFGAAIALMKRRASGEEKPIRTPWIALDNALDGGLWPGSHMLVAGTGIGKTQLTLQIAETAARAGVPIGLVELELDEEQVALRVLSEHDALSAPA